MYMGENINISLTRRANTAINNAGQGLAVSMQVGRRTLLSRHPHHRLDLAPRVQ